MRASSGVDPLLEAVEAGERDAHEDALQHGLRDRRIVEPLEGVRAEGGGDQRELVRAHGVVDERRGRRRRRQNGAPAGRHGARPRRRCGRAPPAPRPPRRRARASSSVRRGVVERPGEEVAGIGRRVERPPAHSPADRREERADRPRLPAAAATASSSHASASALARALERVAELLLGRDLGAHTIRSASRRNRIARGTTVSAAWLCLESSTPTRPRSRCPERAQRRRKVDLALAEVEVVVHAAAHVLDVHVGEPRTRARIGSTTARPTARQWPMSSVRPSRAGRRAGTSARNSSRRSTSIPGSGSNASITRARPPAPARGATLDEPRPRDLPARPRRRDARPERDGLCAAARRRSRSRGGRSRAGARGPRRRAARLVLPARVEQEPCAGLDHDREPESVEPPRQSAFCAAGRSGANGSRW